VEISPDDTTWRSPVHGVPFHVQFSWLQCDLAGKHCSTLPGLRTASIVPPQELRIVTLRAVETATNRYGSNSVTSDLYYDEAGFPVEERADLHPLIYDPAQLRAWYGLSSDQNGAGQTIVVTSPLSVGDLRAAVAHFSAHYDLPQPCASASGTSSCFGLTTLQPLGRPRYSAGYRREIELDVEWAHAIAPAARVEVVESYVPEFVISRIARRTGAHVFSSSWSWPADWGQGLALRLFGLLARHCGASHVVCLWASGDARHPGRSPANSPAALAVGGSAFASTPDGVTGTEQAWPDSGGGTTRLPEPRPTWQRNLPCDPFNGNCTNREIPDVSATAAGVRQYDPGLGWTFGGGTSLATPLWAALIAITDQKLQQDGQPPIGIDELHQVLYRGDVAGGLADIGKPGWDAQTGWGSPKAGIVDVLAKAIEHYREAH
jgi:subtilase family serine protease